MDLPELLASWRHEHGLSQAAAAVRLDLSQSTASRIEAGAHRVRDVGELRRLARSLGARPESLGVVGGVEDDGSAGLSREQGRWCADRSLLNARRAALSGFAATLHPEAIRVADTPVLSTDRWLFDAPVPIEVLRLAWRDAQGPVEVDGRGAVTEPIRPLRRNGGRFERYSHAVRDLARPRLYDNRPSYRLLDVDLGRRELGFSYTSYFDTVDVCEAVAHEFTAAWGRAGERSPTSAELPLRRAIGDPFDLQRRPVFPSINTLTIRRDPIDGHRMFLHARDSQAVAVGGGMHHVAPAGAFQPSSIAPAHQASDFDLWRCLAREYSEEFLGSPEHDGSSMRPIDYECDEPFSAFEMARRDGCMSTWVFGLVIEPLTLWVELLTATIIEANVFDALFADMVTVNDEGVALGVSEGGVNGFPFVTDVVHGIDDEALSPIAAATLRLSWRHRFALLGR